jgi:hypothetical protein
VKSAEDLLREHSSVCPKFPDPTCGGCMCNADLAAIRAAQIDAAEWMGEEAARLLSSAAAAHKDRANNFFDGKDQGSAILEMEQAHAYTNAVGFIRSIKLPGEAA